MAGDAEGSTVTRSDRPRYPIRLPAIQVIGRELRIPLCANRRGPARTGESTQQRDENHGEGWDFGLAIHGELRVYREGG
jgi:hypothetical protein